MSAPPPAAPDGRNALGAAEFAALLAALGPFERAPRLVVAVSGGCDSMALALLSRAWAEAHGGTVLALIVDHGLRPESAAEAALVEGWLAAHRIEARTLRWLQDKPAHGSQAAAREARYGLLEDACRKEGILHLLLAHHAGDQAETVAMRAERASGPCGRAGMATVAERRGLRLLRPLLAVRRARLEARLRGARQVWLDDPSNRDRRFRRSALRQAADFALERWWQEGCRCGEERAAADRAVGRFFARAIRLHPLGQVTLDPAPFAALPIVPRAAALARILRAVRGGRYPPAIAAVRLLAERLGGPGLQRRATLAGCILEQHASGLVVTREPGRITDRRLLTQGASVRWDRRFEIGYAAGPGPLWLAALGEAGRRGLPVEVRARLRTGGASAAAVAALPALWAPDGLAACPPLTGWGLRPPLAAVATAELQVEAPLSGAAFAAVNIVSKAQHLIYPPRAGVKPLAEMVGAASR